MAKWYDAIALSWRFDSMKCPRDNSLLNPLRYEANIDIDYCPTCKGTWLDKGELEAIQKTVERDYSQLLNKSHLPDKVDAIYTKDKLKNFKSLSCPKCGGIMENRDYGYGSQVRIDSCIAGCGIWLDEGELQSLEIFFEKAHQEISAEEQSSSQGIFSHVVDFFKPKS